VRRRRLGISTELARFFLWLGTVSFGGPVVHLALLEEHTVRRRQWLTSDEFLELLGLTNLIPGPNSTEMAMAIGYKRAGLAGLLVAGACFILPAACLTMLLAWLYVRYAGLPWLQPALAGLAPAVLVVMAQGAWRLGREAVTSAVDIVAAVVVLGLALYGVSEIVLLAGAAIAGALLPLRRYSAALAASVLAGVTLAGVSLAATVQPSATLADLAAFFLRVGAVLYGGGYVLVSFLQGLVDHQGWLTQRELFDAVAAGQVTPGPVLTTATFVGYLVLGPAGAVVATVAIFLPAFVFTAVMGPLTPWLRRSAVMRRAVRLVSVAAVAIVVAVTSALAVRVTTSPLALIPIAAASLVALGGGGAVGVLVAGMFASALVAGLG
jgi:chromate transporter